MSLYVSSKSEIKYIPFRLFPNKRLNFRKIPKLSLKEKTRSLLVYKDIPFILKIAPVIISIKKKNKKHYVRRSAGIIRKAFFIFKNKKTKRTQKVSYFVIEIDPKIISPSIRDVVFFHELREMYYMAKLDNSQKVAHQKALKDEKKYVEKFLSEKEKQIYYKFRKEEGEICEEASKANVHIY